MTTKITHAALVEEIDAATKERTKFTERGRATVKRFVDERDLVSADNKWFNIFYANTNILESALYSELPNPTVSRRFKDYEDQVARVAALMLQRSITQDLDDPRDTFDSTLRQCVQDRLVPGLAQAWLRLETITEPLTESYGDMPPSQPDTDAGPPDLPQQPMLDEDGQPMMRIVDQKVCVDYVFWEDFLWSPCRVWDERRWVGRKVYMSRDELVKRFGAEKGERVPLDYKPNGVGRTTGPTMTPQDNTVHKAVIYELWVRDGRKVVWLSLGFNELLDVQDDPLKLVGFEPCPRPMLANLSTSNTIPRPDYYMIQDQYSELDTINNRISLLVRACKVVGVYDKGSPAIGRMLKEGSDNQLIPADNWAMFSEKGGVKGQIDWLPLEVVVQALNNLQMAREAIKAQIYELTGIADIVRGASKASETLGAQQIKAKFASVRIKKLQDAVARFAAEILRIKAEIQCKHFEPEIILRNSNMQHSPDAELLPQAMGLLKDPSGFEWRITVTADSIAQADYDMEKADRIEFMTAVSSYLEKAATMFQAVPQSATLLVGMLKWAIAGFRNADEIEGMIDEQLDQITKNPPQDKPDPEQQRQQAEQAQQQQQMQMEQQKAQMQMQLDQQKAQMEQQQAQMEFQMEQQKLQMEFQLEQQRQQMELEGERQRLAMESQRMEMEMAHEAAMNAIKLASARDMNEQKLTNAKESKSGD